MNAKEIKCSGINLIVGVCLIKGWNKIDILIDILAERIQPRVFVTNLHIH